MLVCLFEKNKRLLFNLSLLNIAVLSLVHITDYMFVCDKISEVQFQGRAHNSSCCEIWFPQSHLIPFCL